MTIVETDEPAHALDGINGEGVMPLRRAACQRGMVEVVVTQDAQALLSAGRIAFRRDGRVVDQIPSVPGSGSLLAGGHP